MIVHFTFFTFIAVHFLVRVYVVNILLTCIFNVRLLISIVKIFCFEQIKSDKYVQLGHRGEK